MKKRIFSLTLLTALLLSLLAGCSLKKPAPTPSPTYTPEPTPTVDPHEGMIEVTDGAGGTKWVYEAEELTPFAYNRYAFYARDGVIEYDGEETISFMRGIDVSEYQHEIDWQAVADAGVEFAIIRCGWRGNAEGSMYPDEMYRENIEGAQAAGLKVGVYFFSQAISLMEGAAEAVYTAQLLDGYTLDLPVFFDWEPADTGRTANTGTEVVTAAALEFCRLLESEGYEAGIYTYIPDVYTRYDLNQLKDITIWMGDPGTWPEFYYEHDYWQYSFTGSVPGIEGDVDLDVIYMREQAQPVASEISQTVEVEVLPAAGAEAQG